MKKLGFVAGLLYAFQLSAATVTSGFIHVTSSLNFGTFQLSGNGFDVQGEFIGGTWQTGPVDTAFSLIGSTCCSEMGAGSGTVMGVYFPAVSFGSPYAVRGSALSTNGPTITFSGPGSYSAPFTFSGTLCGSAGNSFPPTPDPCLIDLPTLTGSGIATVTVTGTSTTDLVAEVNYVFAIPEPSSIALVAAPILLMIGRKYLQRMR